MRTVVWESRQEPGLERATLSELPDGWRLAGTVIEAQPALVTDVVTLAAGWITCQVDGVITSGAALPITLSLTRDSHCLWTTGRTPEPKLAWFDPSAITGLLDIDLAFTLATDKLPIRRCQPAIGETIAVAAAWLCFPELVIQPLPQRYTWLTERQCRYEPVPARPRRRSRLTIWGWWLTTRGRSPASFVPNWVNTSYHAANLPLSVVSMDAR